MYKMSLNNVLIIAKKEFSDLISNWMMLVVLVSYLVFIGLETFGYITSFNTGVPSIVKVFMGDVGAASAYLIYWDLTQFGAIIGVMIGCLSIANERHNNALNTLIVKPIFRDTIINGKLLGSVSFLVFIIGFILIIYTSGLLIFLGNQMAPFIGDYTAKIIMIFVLSIVFILFFFLLSMFISLVVRNQAFAMILSLIPVYLSNMVCSSVYASDMTAALPFGGYIAGLVASVSPTDMMYSLIYGVFRISSPDVVNTFMIAVPVIVKLLGLSFVICILCYIIFIRRDIT